jgi:hypothetical protein
VAFGALDAVTASEVIRDLVEVTATARPAKDRRR